jgi:hypothetical protein
VFDLIQIASDKDWPFIHNQVPFSEKSRFTQIGSNCFEGHAAVQEPRCGHNCKAESVRLAAPSSRSKDSCFAMWSASIVTVESENWVPIGGETM